MPISVNDPGAFSKSQLIEDLYENEFIKYLNIVFPEYTKQREIITTISTMTHMSKFGGIDGKDFENSLKPAFELFREVLNIDIISGKGNTDLLCAVEDPKSNNEIYKMNVDGKSRKSSSNLKATRLLNHLKINGSKYCIVVAPRFSKGIEIDIGGLPIVAITVESLSRYLIKECLSSSDSYADYIAINDIIQSNLGKNITKNIDNLTIERYGFVYEK